MTIHLATFRRPGWRNRIAAHLAILALVLHALAPMAMAAPADTSLEAALKFICSINRADVADGQQPARPGDSCPLCPVLAKVAMKPAELSLPLPVAFTAQRPHLPAADVATAQPLISTILPRGPPVRIA